MEGQARRVIAFAWAFLFCLGQASETNAAPAEPAVHEDAADPSPPAPPDDAVYGTLNLETLKVSVPPFKIPRPVPEAMKVALFMELKFDFGWPVFGANYVLTPGRIPQRTARIAQTTRVLEANEFSFSALPLSAADFAPTDRSHAARGRTTDRDLKLRGLSSLVLLDGAPLNDPFDGGIPWARLPREGLARIELVPGGGATAWGNGATGGAVQFLTLPAKGKMVLENFDPEDGGPSVTKQNVYGVTRLALSTGDFNTQGAEFATSQLTTRGVLQILGRGFHTDGFPLLGKDQRGPIDLPAGSRSRWLETRWRQPLRKDVELIATLSHHDESGGSGTPYQQGNSRSTFASIAIAASRTFGVAWNALVYAQSGSAANRFSTVDTARVAETPLLDRYAVPAEAFGASWTGTWRLANDARTTAGVDVRRAQGETRENTAFANGLFARQLSAGGTQGDVGAFLSHEHVITKSLRAVAGVRIDAWQESNGHQREIVRFSQATVQDTHYATDTGTEFSPSLGVVWQPGKTWRWRVNGQRAFRRPTLAERYQSSQHADVLTAPNPFLRTEHNTSFEAAAEYSFYRGKSSPALTLEARAFHNELRDAIGTVTLARGSGELPQLDTLPPGYRGVKRINLDQARLQGVEFSARWQLATTFTLEASVQATDATLRRSAAYPLLEDRQLPEIPRRTFALRATWRPTKEITTKLRIRSVGRQFIDAENTLPVADALIADLAVNYLLNKHTELYLTAENFTDSSVETGRNLSGLVYLGAPRTVQGGLRLTW